jgi:hypothetical protein
MEGVKEMTKELISALRSGVVRLAFFKDSEPKREVADKILDRVVELLSPKTERKGDIL